jgi:hypothetical protein
LIPQCVWRSHSTGLPCGGAGSFFHNLVLCDIHKIALSHKISAEPRRAATYHRLDVFPGICYVVLLANGYVKVGYSNNRALLKNRMETLNPVFVIDELPGGFVTEYVLHYEMSEYRVPGVGEIFDCSVNEARRRIEKVALAGGLVRATESRPPPEPHPDAPLDRQWEFDWEMVDCASCGQWAGDPCRSASGRIAESHVSRVQKTRELKIPHYATL